MFKKKGKGKEDDIIEEEIPRPKGKRERVKEALVGSSLSPSKHNKHKKKSKVAKEKKAVNGKVGDVHLPEEAEVQQVDDFYVDDDGTVQLGCQQEDRSFVDEVMSSVEESFTLDHEKSLNLFDKEEDLIESGPLKAKDEEVRQETPHISENGSEPEVYSPCHFIGDEESDDSSNCNVKPPPEEAEQITAIHSQNNEAAVGEECKDLGGSDGDHESELIKNEPGSGGDFHESELIKNEEPDLLDKKESELEEPHATDNLNPCENEADLESSHTLNDTECPGNQNISVPKEEIDIGSVSEEKTSFASAYGESQFQDDENAKNSNTDDEAEDLQEESAEKPPSENMASSQDSDDDFDSAQEDWDDDDGEQAKNLDGALKPDSGDSVGLEHSHPQHPVVNEAKNDALLDENTLLGSSRKRGSSVYEDASGIVLKDSGLLEESSDDKPALEENRKARKISGSEKLVRKLSNISAASSDAFNEELDDLLDEELDRLSEEEEAVGESHTNDVNKESKLKDSIDSGVADHIDVETVSEEVVTGMADHIDVEAVSEEVVTNKASHDDSAVCSQGKSEHDDKEMTGINDNAGDNILSAPIISTDKDPATTDGDVDHSGSDSKDGSTLGSNLSASEENSDQVKDSGYYSLPVSPNPGALVRATAEEDRPAKKVDDSFGDSEEEGMITPCSEASTLEDKTENSNEEVDVAGDDTNTTSISELDTSPQTKEEDTKPPEPKRDVDVADAVALHPAPKQGANLKVIIPSTVEKGEKEKESDGVTPKCTSPTKIRHKSPLKEGDEAFSPDPIGDRFLEQAVLLSHGEVSFERRYLLYLYILE